MLSFIEFLFEAALSGGEKGQYNVDKYVTPHVGSDEPTHSMHGDIGTLKKGDRISVVGHHVQNGKHHLRVKDASGKEHTVPMAKVAKPTGTRANVMRAEDNAISDMDSHIKKAMGDSDHIKMNINGEIHHITGCEKVKGTPKADFKLTDKNGKHIYLSHKDGKDVTDYQQFGGALEHKNTTAFKTLSKHIKDEHGGDMKKAPGTTAVRLDRSHPEDDKILHQAAFGKDHGKDHGENNVHAIVQGKLGIQKNADGTHSMTAHHIIENKGGKGKLPDNIGGFMSARVANGRSDGGHSNTRMGVIPTNLDTGKDGRKITTEVSNNRSL